MKDIGRQLRAKRDELGLTLEQIQAETKIRRRYLEALETGKEDLIPGEVYVKGFLRFYANFLGLDGQALVKEYNAAKEAQAAEADGATPGARPAGAAPMAGRTSSRSSRAGLPISATGPPLRATQGTRDGRFGRLLVYALVIVLLVIAAGVYYTWSHAQSATGGETGDGQGGSSPVAGGATSGGSGDGSGGGAGDVSGTSPGEPDSSGSSGASEPHWAVVSESDALVGHVVYGAPFTVRFEVVAETCWIRIRADGETVLEKTLDAGAKVEWTAKSSLTVVLGRPQLVKVGVDGQPLGLAGSKDEPRTLTFEAASPPSGGEGAGGA